MRRPLCVFCAGMLGVALVCDFLPQTELFVPFAAFFVAFCLLLCIPDRTRKALLCLLLGAAAGLAAARHTNARLEQTLEKYAGQTVALTAEVESVSVSYYPGIVDAVLRVERVNGRAAEFRVECDTLPVCEAGERVEGRFALEAPEPADRTTLFADGVVLWAREPQAFARLGKSSSFRARTSRLQKRLSTSLRGEMNEDAGGVLAAMTVGDRNHLSSALRSAYRGAGLSHVLVVSGMHVSILCGDVFGSVFGRRRRERSYRSRRVKALFTAFLALLLAGVTGFTPSVCRAAVAVWVSALGVWVYGASDALTSLAAAGILMTARNSYAVCDIGFELSFAAVVGTVAGGAYIRRIREWWCQDFWKKSENPVRRPWYLRVFPDRFWGLAESACISLFASAATFPVLVLRGLSVSLWAVASGVAVLWMVKPMMLLGLGTAFAGLVPAAGPLYTMIGKAAEFLTGLLNRWAVWVSAKPGAGLYFDTNYAALVCLLLMALCGLAHLWKVRLRVAVPGLLLTAVLAIGVGNALCRDVVHVDLVGSANSPAVVVSQNHAAVVLFRGGASTQRAVENQLARRGVTTVELLADLRLDPENACTLPARTMCRVAVQPVGSAVTRQTSTAAVETLRTRFGCLVRLTIGEQQFVTVSGTVTLAEPVRVQWLLASPAKPEAVQWEQLLSRSDHYQWMQGGEAVYASLSLRPSGGWRAE